MQTASFFEGLAERWRRIDRFDPPIDRLVRDLGIFGPVWINPQRKTSKVRCFDSGLNRIASTSSVGAMFQLIADLVVAVSEYDTGEQVHLGDQEKPGARPDCFCVGVHGGMPA